MNLPHRYLYDDRKLRNRALTEFARALRNDRMIAITGSMSNEALGYCSWEELEIQIGKKALELAADVKAMLGRVYARLPDDGPIKGLLRTIDDHATALVEGGGGKMEPRVRLGIVGDCFESLALQPAVKSRLAELRLDRDRQASLPPEKRWESPPPGLQFLGAPGETFVNAVAGLFKTRFANKEPSSAAIRPLLESLGISRIATLNYDFELERALMLRMDEREAGETKGESRPRPVLEMVGDARSGMPIVSDRIGRLRRVMGDGLTVESDIMDRERPDRLFEFAIGSAEIDRHVLHLHGRADEPRSMVFTMRDYDHLYRRDDLFRNPFEHGMRVLFAGNPVLFVGLGMTEKELNDFLQYFVSNTPYRRMAPAFLIWNTLGMELEKKRGKSQAVAAESPEDRATAMQAMRIDYLQRLGIYVIFDEDVLPRGGQGPAEAEGWLETFRAEYAEASKDAPDSTARSKRQIELDALVFLLNELPSVVAELGEAADRTGDGTWRSIWFRAAPPALGGDGKGDPPDSTEAPAGGFVKDEPVRLWGMSTVQVLAARENAEALQSRRYDIVSTRSSKRRPEDAIMVGVAVPGAGRGTFSECMAQLDLAPDKGLKLGDWVIRSTKPYHRLLVNAGFSYDADAMLSAIALFLKHRNSELREEDRLCREQGFSDQSLFNVDERALIIINGIDRFFGFDGQPLSAELDHLLRCAHGARNAGYKLQWLILGAERVRGYFRSLGIEVQSLDEACLRIGRDGTGAPEAGGAKARRSPPVKVDSRYLDWVASRFARRADSVDRYRRIEEIRRGKKQGPPEREPEITEAAKARLRTAKAIDRESIRRAFFSGYLAPPLLQTLGFDCPTTFELLRTMAFIGSPIEATVLLHAPKVVAILDERRKGKGREAFLLKTLRGLVSLGLILPTAPTVRIGRAEPPLRKRYALHRSLATELRERHGAPISEAKLSTTFNMSLFAAQPGDTYTPDEHFHDELGELVDRLIGAWKDQGSPPESEPFPVEAASFHADEESRKLIYRPSSPEDAFRDFEKLCRWESAACLRAALAVVRGYYSTGSLLTLSRESQLVAGHREGALSEHAQRIDRLLKGFGKIATARGLYRKLAFGEELKNPTMSDEDRQREISRRLGPEPLYPDDLVWLHNERGVVKLAQGHLYDARRSFSLAETENRKSLEFDHRGHNWRRININMVGLLIERGLLTRAERRVDAVEESIETANWRREDAVEERKPGDPPPVGRVAAIRMQFSEPGQATVLCESPNFTREEILVVGLTTGYRALIDQMRGKYRTAERLYERATRILRRLSEMRAYAIFQRHYSSLGRHLGFPEEVNRELNLAIAAADSIQQQDIAHRLRIYRAGQIRREPKADSGRRRMALHDLHRALDYAALADSYRVRIEASTRLAGHMRESGDYDTALRYASDALAIACRYGHSLHKIALRVEIGQILIQRGDPQSGIALIERAEESAARTGYHRIAERVQDARRQEARISAAAQPVPSRE